jgi:hypothetical protein
MDVDDELDAMMADARDVIDLAKSSGDLRLRILAIKELRPILELREKMRDKAKSSNDERRRLGVEVWASMPTEFVQRIRDGDPTLLGHIADAVSLAQDAICAAEPKQTAAEAEREAL